jgi:hypothetical protein
VADDKKIRLDETETNDWTGERDRICDLYARRLSITYIAQAVGRSAAYVSKVLHSEFAERNANRQQIVLAHHQTLSWMIQKATKRMAEAKDFWDRRDAELVLKLLEREARLFGVDQPTQHTVTVELDQLTDDELLTQLQAAGVQITLPAVTSPPALPEHVEDAHYEPTSSDPTEYDGPAEGDAGQTP